MDYQEEESKSTGDKEQNEDFMKPFYLSKLAGPADKLARATFGDTRQETAITIPHAPVRRYQTCAGITWRYGHTHEATVLVVRIRLIRLSKHSRPAQRTVIADVASHSPPFY